MMIVSIRNNSIFKPDTLFRGAFVALLLWGLNVPLVHAAAPEMDESTRRQKIFELYQKQIPLLEQHIQRNPNGPRTAESMFRLGEAYFETAKYYQILSNDARVSLFNQKAIEVLEKLRQSQPQYPRLDEALYVLASTYLERGENESAGPVLAELANRFPNSKVLENSSYLLGDYYFDLGQYAQAKPFYQKALDNKRSEAYANYKLAWISIHESQPALALRFFEKVLALSAQAQASFDYSRDAAREMVWPAIEVYGGSRVLEYLDGALKNPELNKIGLEALAMGLSSKGEYRLSSSVFEHLTKRYPSDPQLQSWIAKQLENEEKLGRSDRIVDLVSKLNGSGTDSSEVQSKIYASAKKYHALAQAEQAPAMKNTLYDQAIAYYQAYLQIGPQVAKAHEVQFYMGEALFARARHNEALVAYKNASRQAHEKQVEAAWNWYLTAEKLAPGFKYEGKELRQATAQDEEFLEAARFAAQLESLPLDRRRRASYQAARLLYQLNDNERALPIFKQLAEVYPQSQEGKLSADLVLDIYNLQENFQQVAKYAKEYQGMADSAKRSEWSVLEAQAGFKTIQNEEAQAKNLPENQKWDSLKRVSHRYMDFARTYPQSKLVDAAIWAAIQLQASVASHEGDKEFSDLRASFNLLMQKYSQSSYSGEAVKLMGDFLAYQGASPEIYKAYASYRNAWERQMQAQPAISRGALAMIVYNLSTDAQKRELEKEFAKLPNSKENREPLALGRMNAVRALAKSFESIQLKDLKTLGANTKNKIQALEKLEQEVTSFVSIGFTPLAIESLYLLSNAYAGMGQALRDAPEPQNLEGENIQKYRAAVSEKASGFEQKAREIRAAADKTSKELDV